ncbi:MAG: TRAP transporter small permease subunit [Paracoccaceae bacterium]|jgi:hypothetical protein
MFDTIARRLSQGLAILGGCVLIGFALVICVSVIGMTVLDLAKALGLKAWMKDAGLGWIGPIQGDYEIVEMGMAWAIFAFLPITTATMAHARVEVMTTSFAGWVQRALDMFWMSVMAAVMIFIAERLFMGLISKLASGDQTFLLQIPLWWGYLGAFALSVMVALIEVYCALRRAWMQEALL